MGEAKPNITGQYFIGARKMHKELRNVSVNARAISCHILAISNPIGLFELNTAGEAKIAGLTEKDFAAALRELCALFGWIWNEETWHLFIPSYFKWNHPGNPDQMKFRMGFLSSVSDMDLFEKWVISSREWIAEDPPKYRLALEKAISAVRKTVSKEGTKPARAPKPKKEPKVYSEAVERLYVQGLGMMTVNGHTTGKDAKSVENDKSVVDKMIRLDKISEADISTAISYIATNTHEPQGERKWRGWGPVIKSFTGLRRNWPTFRSDALASTGKPKSLNDKWRKEGSKK